MSYSKIVKSKAICPKCGSNNLLLNELWRNHGIQWEQINGEFDRADGTLTEGDAYKVEGRCKDCKHGWTFRNIPQIEYLVKD